MDIELPDMILFYTERWKPQGRPRRGKKVYEFKIYCFPHAVLRALEGEQIKTKVTTESQWMGMLCDDCKNFGVPNSHDLGTLRTDSAS